MAATTAAIIGASAAVGGVALSAKAQSDAKKAAAQAANTPAPQVNIAQTDAQARQAALQNAIDSAALERQFNPGAAELRAGGLEALLANLNAPQGDRDALSARVAQQAGNPLTVGAAQQYDSALTRQAVQAAADQLALGGELPQDVRNLVARQALARSGSVTGGLTLGRDLTTRDLGLTSLDLQRARIAQAAALGQQEAALEAGNAGLRLQNDAQRLEAEQFGRNNLLQSASFMDQIASGDFARAFQAAQLGQNIAQPQSGLDPGAIANLAVGNVNAQAGKQQQAFGAQIGAANAAGALGGNLTGAGLGVLGMAAQFYKPTPVAPTGYTTTYTSTAGAPAASSGLGTQPYYFCWVAREVYGSDNPEWTQFRDWLLGSGSPEFVEFYRQNGEAIAAEISSRPNVKQLVRHLMDAIKGGAK